MNGNSEITGSKTMSGSQKGTENTGTEKTSRLHSIKCIIEKSII